MTFILNFAHPITDAQRDQIAALLNADPSTMTVVTAPSQIDPQQPMVAQVKVMLETGLAFVRDEAQKQGREPGNPRDVIVNLPGFAPSAAVLTTLWVLAHGTFPTILRLRPSTGVVPGYEVAELIDLTTIAA